MCNVSYPNNDIIWIHTVVYNNDNIPEADEYTSDLLDDTYLNMQAEFPRNADWPLVCISYQHFPSQCNPQK